MVHHLPIAHPALHLEDPSSLLPALHTIGTQAVLSRDVIWLSSINNSLDAQTVVYAPPNIKKSLFSIIPKKQAETFCHISSNYYTRKISHQATI